MAAKPEPRHFRHTRLCDNRPNFRLLRLDRTGTSRLSCELVEAELNDRDLLPYTAISHRWQNGEKTQAIWIGGAKFLVTPGLHSLLLSLQAASLYPQHPWYEYGYFWIDAICIDQNDEAEKSHQVSQMKKIYTNATHVVVWLGDATSDSKLVMKGLAALQDLKEQQERAPDGPGKTDETRLALLWERLRRYVLKENELDRLAESLGAMLSHSWFKRVWVLQEVANARSAFILCGNESISTRYFVLAPRLLGAEPSPHCQAVLDLMPGSRKKRSDTDGDGPKSDLYNLLLRFRGAEASLDKDRIFALFGLCSEETEHLALKYYSMPQLEIFRAIISHVWGCSIELVPRRLVMSSAGYGQCVTIDEFLSDLEGISTALLMHWVSAGSGVKYSDLRDILLGDSRCVYTPAQALEVVAQHPTHAAELVSLVARRIPQRSFRVSDATLLSIARNARQGGEIMRSLAMHCSDGIILTESVVLALHRNRTAGLEILSAIAPRLRKDGELKLTGRTALSLWEDEVQGRAIEKILFRALRVRLYFQADELSDIMKSSTMSPLLSNMLEWCTSSSDEVGNDVSVTEAIHTGLVCISDSETSHLGVDELHGLTHSQTDILLRQVRRGILDKNNAAMSSFAGYLSIPALYSHGNTTGARAPLFIAAEGGDTVVLKSILESEHQANYNNHIDSQDYWGESALALASRYGHAGAVSYLLCERAAPTEVRSLFGWTPLHLAAGGGHLSVVNGLLASGADVNAHTLLFGWTPLHLAAEGGHGAVVRALIKFGARVGVGSDVGDTALDFASREGHLAIVAELSLIQYS